MYVQCRFRYFQVTILQVKTGPENCLQIARKIVFVSFSHCFLITLLKSVSKRYYQKLPTMFLNFVCQIFSYKVNFQICSKSKGRNVTEVKIF